MTSMATRRGDWLRHDKTMEIDILVDVQSPEAGLHVAALAAGLGYRTRVDHGDEDETWTCCCMRPMVPTYEDVCKAQSGLDELSGPLDGCIDGWGTLENWN
jgi:hypothetical protein